MNFRRQMIFTVVALSMSLDVAESQLQSKIRYHAFSPTSSIAILTQWNIKLLDSTKWYIRETIDSRNRVTEIAFFYKHGIFNGFTCWEPSIVTFAYSKNTIVEMRWDAQHNPMTADACSVPHKSVYHLNDRHQILWADRTYLEEGSTAIKKDTVYIKSIWNFYYSSVKMNGINPMAPSDIPSEEETGEVPVKLK